MADAETFQIPLEVAQDYESRFVPALFADWAPHTVTAADLGPGDSLLDVACGTGIVSRTAHAVVGPSGRVVGLDRNEAMLTVARTVCPAGIGFRIGDAEDLPFADDEFDAATCQMAAMFFADRVAAFAELARVVRPAGAVVVMVPARLEDQPAYRPLVELAAGLAGPEAVDMLSAYWVAGDLDALTEEFTSAGLAVVATRTRTGTARFASLDEFVAVEVEATPVRARLSDEQYDALRVEAGRELADFATADGRAEIPLVGHLVVGRPARG